MTGAAIAAAVTNELSAGGGPGPHRCRHRQGERPQARPARSQSWRCVQAAWGVRPATELPPPGQEVPTHSQTGSPSVLRTSQLLPRPTPAPWGQLGACSSAPSVSSLRPIPRGSPLKFGPPYTYCPRLTQVGGLTACGNGPAFSSVCAINPSASRATGSVVSLRACRGHLG